MVTCFPAPGRAGTMSAGCRPGVGRAMGAVWMRLRSELRARWWAWLGLALLIGLGGGAAVAAAAGARRTETAYPRFVQAQQGYDLVTGGFPELPKGMLHQAKLVDWLVEHGKATAPLVTWLATTIK